MKYFRILFFELLLCGILFVGCQDEILSARKDKTAGSIPAVYPFEQRETLPDVSRLDPVALAFCRRHEQELLSSLHHSAAGIEPLIYPGQNSICREELENINIVDSCLHPVSFFSLSEKEQKDFLDDWTDFQAAQLTKKIAFCPELREYLQAEVKEDYPSLVEFLRQDSIERSHSSSYAPRSTSDNTDYKIEDASIVIRALSQYGRRGDLLITPARENSSSPIDVKRENWHKFKLRFGHVAILTKQVPSNATAGDKITVSATPGEGVHEEKLSEWCCICCLMGVQNVSYEWRLLRKTIKHCSSITYPDRLATRAESFMGHRYVHPAEFLTAKWFAPDRFTCATLPWWSAKKEFGIDLSSKNTSCVSPGDILTNDHIYMRCAIKKKS